MPWRFYNKMKITFIIGGARSGKSSFALTEASRAEGRKTYIATAEALDEEMIDGICYFEDALETILSMAGISDAQVVEYQRPLSLMSLLGYQNKRGFKLDKKTLYELMLPEALYLCDITGGN